MELCSIILDETAFLALVSSNGSIHQIPGMESNTLASTPDTSNEVGNALPTSAKLNFLKSNMETISRWAEEGRRGSKTTR